MPSPKMKHPPRTPPRMPPSNDRSLGTFVLLLSGEVGPFGCRICVVEITVVVASPVIDAGGKEVWFIEKVLEGLELLRKWRVGNCDTLFDPVVVAVSTTPMVCKESPSIILPEWHSQVMNKKLKQHSEVPLGAGQNLAI